ncbi:MAG: hypothetical protein WC562_08315 [Dehalococcoidia bacterium]
MPDDKEDRVLEGNDDGKKKKGKGTKARVSLRLPSGLTSLLAATALAASAAAIAITVTTTCDKCPAGPPGPPGPEGSQGAEGASCTQTIYSGDYELTCGEETIINVNLEKDDLLQGFLLNPGMDATLSIAVPAGSSTLVWQDTNSEGGIEFTCVADTGGVYSLTIAAQQCTTGMKSRGVTLVYWVTR